MQHHIEYDSETKVLVVTLSGTATVEGFHDYIDALAGHPDLSHCIGIISDLCKLDLKQLSSVDVRNLVEYVSGYAEKWSGMAGAIVVSQASDYGLSRMYEILGEERIGYRSHVFYALEEAKVWIKSGES